MKKVTFSVGDKVLNASLKGFERAVALYVISPALNGVIEIAPTQHGAGSYYCLVSKLVKA